jgi:hypothetical protein
MISTCIDDSYAFTAAAGLPADVSALRVFDVIAWLEGKDEALP